MAKLRDVLSLPAAYRLFGRLVLGDGRHDYVRRHLRPHAGERVFDLGCGPGDILEALPEVDYVGIDLDPNYIAAATARWGQRGKFRCEDVAVSAARQPSGSLPAATLSEPTCLFFMFSDSCDPAQQASRRPATEITNRVIGCSSVCGVKPSV